VEFIWPFQLIAVAAMSTLASTAYLSAGDGFVTATEYVCVCIGSNPPETSVNEGSTTTVLV